MTVGTSAPVRPSKDQPTKLIECLEIGAGFYLNATNPDYFKHYNMCNYITEELPKILKSLDLPIVRLSSLCLTSGH